ncbi:cytochrome P450 [Amylocystis lapponica]|nr:cytochrome P450 [Amylocystis lapponica]
MSTITMESASTPQLLILACFTLAVVLAFRRRTSLPLPPGPRRAPIFGNLLQVDPLRLYPKFQEWAKEYGEIFSLRFGAQTIVVLNTPEAAQELLVNRGTKYASRASPHIAQDLMSGGQRMLFLPYGDEWKVVRRSLNGAIGPGPSKKVRRFQDLESRVLLHDLMCHGDASIAEPQATGDEVPDGHWFALVRRYSLSIVMNVMYGKRVHRIRDDPALEKVFDVMNTFVRVSQPGSFLADVFPLLRLLPDCLAPWRAHGRKLHTWEMELWGGLLEESKTALSPRGYVPEYIRARADAGFADAPGKGVTADGWMRDMLVAYNAGTVLEAGADTTSGGIQAVVLLMLANPHVLARARAELDAVVGPDRLPQFEDEERLPYVAACVKETLRRRPLAVMAVPHAVVEDDVYKGYLIPKGAMVIGNAYAMQLDETRNPDPYAFKPERFLDDTTPCEHHAFGWGRRICPGRYIAEASLFIVLARIVWALDLHAPTFPDPADESKTGTWSDGFISLPRLFGVAFSVREGREKVVKSAYEEAQTEWEGLGFHVDER